MNRSPLNHQVKEKNEFWLLNPVSKQESVLLALLFLLLPTQFGKHFWPSFTFVSGIRIDYLAPTIYVTDVIVLLLFIFSFIRWIRQRHVDKKQRSEIKNKHQKYFFVFMALSVGLFISNNIFFADRNILAVYYWFKLVEFSFIGFYISKTIRVPSHLTKIALLMAVSTFFEAFLTILQYLKQGSLDSWLYFLGERTFTGATIGIANASINGTLLLRPYGTFSHPNSLAGYLLFASLFLAWFFNSKATGFTRNFGILVLGLASIALFLTLSRTAIMLWFLFVCGLLLWGIFKQSFRRGVISALLVGALLSTIFLPFAHILAERFTGTSFSEEAFTQRTELSFYALSMLQSHPLTGVGLGNFIPTLTQLQGPFSFGNSLQPVHNIFLLIAAEAGILGLIFFLSFLFFTYRRLFIRISKKNALHKIYFGFLLMLSTVLLLGSFDHYFLTLQQGQLLFTTILGLCWADINSNI